MADDNKLTIGLGLPGEGIVESLTETIGKFRETQSPFVRDFFDLWGVEIVVNLRRSWITLHGEKWKALPELEAHIAKMKEGEPKP